MDIAAKVVHVVAKDLLTLLVDKVDIIEDNDFFAVAHGAACLAKDFDVVSVVVDTLFLEVVDKENVVADVGVTWRFSVVLVKKGREKGRFSATTLPHQKQIQGIGFKEDTQEGAHFGVEFKVIETTWLVSLNKEL